jgi:hypothetical protein
MRKNPLRLMRIIAGAASTIGVGMMLAGCNGLGIGMEQRSLKDDWAPVVTVSAAPAPAVTKVSTVAVPRPASSAPAGAKARVDGSMNGCGGDSACLTRLKALVEDPNRKWVGVPQLPLEHADGTRQFAYRALRSKLSCKELAAAIDEIIAATKVFNTAVPGVTPTKAAQVRALNAQIEAELRAERAGRCTN